MSLFSVHRQEEGVWGSDKLVELLADRPRITCMRLGKRQLRPGPTMYHIEYEGSTMMMNKVLRAFLLKIVENCRTDYQVRLALICLSSTASLVSDAQSLQIYGRTNTSQMTECLWCVAHLFT